MKISIQKNSIFAIIALILVNLFYDLDDTIFSFEKSYLMLYISIILFFLHIFLTNSYSIKSLFIFILLFILLGYNYYISNDSRLLVLLTTIVAIKNLNMDTILKITFYERIIVTIIVCGLYLVGFGNYYSSSVCFGFNHENLLMLNIVYILLLYLCINKDNITFSKTLFFLFTILISFLFTTSRTGLVIGFLIWLLLIFYKYFHFDKLISIVSKYLPLFLMFISVFLPVSKAINVFPFLDNNSKFLYNYNIFLNKIDKLLSSRLTLNYLMLSNSSINWLGSTVNTEKLSLYSYTIVDSGYIQTLMAFGYIGTILFIILNFFTTKKLIKRNEYIYLIAIIAMSLYAFSENSWCSLKYNFTLLFFVELFQNYKIKKLKSS